MVSNINLGEAEKHYLYLQVLINFYCRAEDVYVLHETGKFPHASNSFERAIVENRPGLQEAGIQFEFFSWSFSRHSVINANSYLSLFKSKGRPD